MKLTIYWGDFYDAFMRMGRKDNFSYEGLKALFEYLGELEREMQDEMELDVIAFCCEYSEDNITETLEQYNCADMDELQDKIQVIWHDDDTVLYVQQ